jgi:uncharacterized protein YraI
MFNRIWQAAAVAVGLMAVPVAAEAASQALVIGNVNLRTGPSTQYYPIMVLPTGSQVQVYGCLDGYTWCDVSYYQERGWVSSRYLSLFYDDRQLYVPYRPRVTVPFLTFNFGYWDNYYVGRPWYTHRPHYDDPAPIYRPPVYRPPVYRPPVYRPPVYQGQPGNDMPPCNWNNDCPYTQQRPWGHHSSDGNGDSGGVTQGWGGPSSGGDVFTPPKPHKPKPQQQFDGGGVFGGSPGFSSGDQPSKPQKPHKPQGGGDSGVTQGNGGGNAVGIPGQKCVWKDGKCIGQGR